jgi:hypothetical protein
MIPHGVEIFVGVEPIDLRWGFDRLSGIVTERMARKRLEALVWAGLSQPVGAEGLDGARQENHGDTRDEKNYCPHGKPQDRNGTDCVIARWRRRQ